MAMTNDLAAAKWFLEGMSGGAQPPPVLAAVSGGLDSMCLLHLLSTWGRARNLAVTAAHFNHQLRDTAERDEQFVREGCRERQIPFVAGRGNVKKAAEERGLSIEEAARDLRYAFLTQQQQARNCTFILTAHHADDNAETMLLNLLRGTGLRGLAGIPEERDRIARPFLQVTRAELEQYAKAYNIPHVEDETNQLDDAARNVLRHKVLPVLKELNPRAVENMARTAELLTQDEAALAREAEALLGKGRCEAGYAAWLPEEVCRGRSKAVLSRTVWGMLSCVSGHQKDLTAAHVQSVLELLWSLPGKEVSLPYGMVARREACSLCVCRRDMPEEAALRPGSPVRWGGYTLTLLDRREGEGMSLKADDAAVTVAPCRPGERLTLPGAKGSRSVKRLCVDRRITLSERDCLPAIYVGDRLAAVWRLGVDVKFLPEGEACRFIQIIKNTEEKQYEK